ncbi:hypothetical protein AYK20_06130 [Thermoplasmatales archaeon SG8-52-1]|nr:MAG: hypothetical protein AYK20_06130 [Thermoplasmatales archaeon SG8-52-1]
MKMKLVCIFCMLFMISAFANATNVQNHTNEDNQIYRNAPIKVGIISLNDGPEEEWNVTFGGDKYDIFFVVQQTSDGGFVALGGRDATSWDIGGDCWLVKVDENGNMQWNKTYGGQKTDNGHGILQTNDDGYIISAITESYGAGSSDAWLIKTDEYGNEQWNRTFGGKNYDLAEKSVLQTDDGGYLIVGSTYSYGAGMCDGWLIKTDEYGNEQWNKTYGTENNEHFWEVHETSDGGYIMIGYVQAERRDAWVVKTDIDGNKEWDKKFGPAYQGLSIEQCEDGGYICLAEVEDTVFGGYLNAWMVKMDEDGNEEWNKMFITPKGKDRFAVHHNIKLTQDNGYILAGVTNAVLPVYSVGDMWLTKIDGNGNILWEKIIGGLGYDTTYTVDLTSDGGFIISGMTKSFGTGGNFNAWLVKVSDYENQRPNKPITPEGHSSGIPREEYTFSSNAIEPDGEQVYYAWNWGDGNYSYWLGPYSSGETCEAIYSWKNKGDYNIRVKAKDVYGGESDWSEPHLISIKKSKTLNTPFQWLQNYLQSHPNLFPIIRQLLGL